MTPTNPQLPLFPSAATNPLSTSHHDSTSVIDDESSQPNAFDDDDDESRNSADEDSEDVVTLLNSDSHGASRNGRLTYQFVAEKASNLVRLAQSDPVTMGCLSDLLEQLTNDFLIVSGRKRMTEIAILSGIAKTFNEKLANRFIFAFLSALAISTLASGLFVLFGSTFPFLSLLFCPFSQDQSRQGLYHQRQKGPWKAPHETLLVW